VNGLILFEDEHLLVVNKPSGINTHKPDRYAPDGIHEWLCKRFGGRGSGRAEAQRGSQAARVDSRPPTPLSILHRLDKDTSGVLLFGKTPQANQSLSRQFESHQVEKEYLLLSSARPTRTKFRAKSVDGVTEFAFVQPHRRFFLIEARPITGKTHQIRRHAAENGFPIVGDTRYGGEPAPRLMLHAHRLTFEHPARGEKMTMEASVPAAFEEPDALAVAKEFRDLIFDEQTSAFRLISGAADGFPDVIVDSYAGNLLVQWQTEAAAKTGSALLEQLKQRCAPQTIYEQLVTKQKRTVPRLVLEERALPAEAPWQAGPSRPPSLGERPRSRHGAMALQGRIPICENELNLLINFGEGLSTGVFLDQRENRRRLLSVEFAGKTLLNCFAYTCAFSVAAAKAGAITTSIDLSRNYLEWGRDNFRANGINPEAHTFLVGDVFEWCKRFQKRGERWDIVILDPPTFSTTKKGRAFQAERDYEELEALAMPLVTKGGALFCSTNQRTLAPDKFEASLRDVARRAGCAIASVEFETLPFDFRVAEGERPYLKTLWARLG
jgi:23S rRNA (cytosine1962-C5)-methyltransferase